MTGHFLHIRTFLRLATIFVRGAALIAMLTFINTVLPTDVCAQEEKPPTEQFNSVEERRLYNSVQTERDGVREERKELELKKNELKSIEEGVDKKLAEIDAKLEELKELRKQMQTLLAAKSEEEVKKTQDLAKIYEKMSPDKAALALTGLNKQLAADLLASMKVKSAAKILDQLPQQKAKELSTTFSTIQLE
jgi:flagellar motility protein MotE (MotC chaperone)